MRFAKSTAGKAAFAQRSSSVSPRQRTAFILFDGKRTMDEVLVATQTMGVSAQDLQRLVDLGFLEPVDEATGPATSAGALPLDTIRPMPAEVLSEQQRYQLAYPVATRLTAALGLRGLRLNLAVESASGCADLVRLYPKIADAVGPEKARALAQALGL